VAPSIDWSGLSVEYQEQSKPCDRPHRKGRMGSSHHNASAQIVSDGDRSCRFVWVTDDLPDGLAGRTADLMGAGLKVINIFLERDVYGHNDQQAVMRSG
jgi:hypothetical protein